MRIELLRYCPRCGKATELLTCPDDETPTVRNVEGKGQNLAPGAVVGGRYRVLGELGRGGFGVVLDAIHVTTGHPVAIKVLTPVAGVDGQELARRFFQEASTTSRLSHPSTVRVFDFGQTEEGDLFLAMERLTGETLQEQIERGPLSEADSVAIAVDVLRSLAEAHSQGLVHRDLKPANIFLHEIPGGDRVVKVLDFGIVKHTDSGMTQAGKALGTPTHMAPEQSMGKPVDARTDLYALGVVLFECLTGDLPFMAESALALLMLHITEPVPSVAERAPGKVRLALAAVVEKALAKEASARWQNAVEMRVALQAAMGEPVDTSTYRTVNPVLAAGRMPVVGPMTSSGEGARSVATLQGPVAKAVDRNQGDSAMLHLGEAPAASTQQWGAVAPAHPVELPPTRPERTLRPQPTGEVDASERLTAWTAADDGSRVWWSDQTGVVRTAALAGLHDAPMRLRDLTDSLEIGRHEALVTAVVASADGRLVVSGAMDGVVRAWDPVAGVRLAEWRVDGAVTSLALASEGTLLVVGCQDGGASLVDVPGFRVRRVLRGHRGAVTAVAVLGARRLVATAGEDGIVRTWDPVGGGARLALRGQGSPVVAVALGNQAQVLASATWDGVLTLWQTRTGDALWKLQAHTDVIAGVALDRAGAFVATASDDRTAKVFRVGGGELRAERGDFESGAKAVRFVDGALAAVVASWDGTVRRMSW